MLFSITSTLQQVEKKAISCIINYDIQKTNLRSTSWIIQKPYYLDDGHGSIFIPKGIGAYITCLVSIHHQPAFSVTALTSNLWCIVIPNLILAEQVKSRNVGVLMGVE